MLDLQKALARSPLARVTAWASVAWSRRVADGNTGELLRDLGIQTVGVHIGKLSPATRKGFSDMLELTYLIWKATFCARFRKGSQLRNEQKS